MARFFKYRTVQDLQTASQEMGLDLRFSDDLGPLFRPIGIGSLRAGNALCVQPMEGCDGTLEGTPDELTFRRYRRFGAGGAKLIWGEAVAVVEEGRANPRQLWLHDGNASVFEQMLRECRQAHRQEFGDDSDLVVGLQLTHSGRYSYRRPLLVVHDPCLDPRTVIDRATGKTADDSYPLLEDDYLARLPDHYVRAARLAREVGFQFVDVKQCHRYLLNELLAARTRPGRFGGSLDNRTRLAREIFGRIRAEVPGLVLGTRLNLFDSIPWRKQAGSDEAEPCPCSAPVLTSWGTCQDDPHQPDLSEPKQWVATMIELGLAILNASLGNPYASPHLIRPFEYPPPDGYQSPEHPLRGVDRHFRLAEELQRTFPRLPVVGSGYSYLQEFAGQAAAANVRDGRVTFAGFGRATLAQPDFARQLQQTGKLDRKRVCRTFSYCTALMRSKHNELGQFPTGCPPFDREVYGPIWETARG